MVGFYSLKHKNRDILYSGTAYREFVEARRPVPIIIIIMVNVLRETALEPFQLL